MAHRSGLPLRGSILCGVLALASLLALNYDASNDVEVRRWVRDTAAVQAEALPSVNPELERRLLRIGDTVLDVEVARTPLERMLGLSNRESLSEGSGMLLEYEREARLPLWMKDMKFALDMLWFDSGRRLIHIEHGVVPETFPKAFGPEEPAMYALELPAGHARRAGIEVGDMFAWE